MRFDLVKVQHDLGRGGALCKEHNKFTDNTLNWKVEMHYALDMISRSKGLQRCTSQSVGRALIDAGVMGLTLSPAMKLCYLIPYGNQCSASPSYMGLEQIAYKTGFVEGIQCGLVRKNDPVFNDWTDAKGRQIEHKRASGNRGPMTHVYCIAWFSSGRQHVEVMDREQVMACRDAAAKKNEGEIPFTWTGKFRGEMYKKVVLRRAWKHWPRVMNPAVQRMMDAVNRTDPMDFSDDRVVVEKDTLDQEQVNELIQMMADAGIPATGHDGWLAGLANKLGYPRQPITAVKKDDFEAAASLMEEGIRIWRERTSPPSAPVGSAPVEPTQPEAVT